MTNVRFWLCRTFGHIRPTTTGVWTWGETRYCRFCGDVWVVGP